MRFCCERGNRIIQAIQVTTGLSDPDVKNREIEELIEVMRAYNLQEGIILTENESDKMEIDEFRISVIPIWKWLLFQ